MFLIHAFLLALIGLISGGHGATPPAHHHAPVVHPFDNGGMMPG